MNNDTGHRKNSPSSARTRKAVASLALLTVSTPAWAYLDPGTGSMIISAIVGLFATVGLAVKTYWYKLKGLFRRDAPVAETTSVEPPVDSTLDSTLDSTIDREAAEAGRSAES